MSPFTSSLHKLSRWAAWLYVSSSEKKYTQYLYPLILTGVTSLLMVYVFEVNFLGENSLTMLFTRLWQILSGFYIAALAAVSTFEKKGMDQSMPGKPITIERMVRGAVKVETLTRRRYLCMLFGYLAGMSILLYFTGGLANLSEHDGWGMHQPNLLLNLFAMSYLFCSFNVLVNTMLGLFYMVERIHDE